jgi:hypothetical protein
MKHYSFLLILTLALQGKVLSQHTIGDIKYSILEPSKFIQLNPDWLLMDGGTSTISDSIFKKSKLHLEQGIAALPDARGMFIRGMNLGRPNDKGDSEGDSTVGRYQYDAIKKHTHDLNTNQHAIATMHGSDKAEGGTDRYLSTSYNLIIQIKDTGTNLNGEETRPRNIALYTYIKVN